MGLGVASGSSLHCAAVAHGESAARLVAAVGSSAPARGASVHLGRVLCSNPA